MKFVRADGTIVPLYQQLTQLVDEQLIAGIASGASGENMTPAQATAISQAADRRESGGRLRRADDPIPYRLL